MWKKKIKGRNKNYAVGNTYLMFGFLIDWKAADQPCPVSPKPCRNITDAVCFTVGFKITDISFLNDLLIAEFGKINDLFKLLFLLKEEAESISIDLLFTRLMHVVEVGSDLESTLATDK